MLVRSSNRASSAKKDVSSSTREAYARRLPLRADAFGDRRERVPPGDGECRRTEPKSELVERWEGAEGGKLVERH